MKKFTINCDFGGQMAPFTVFIGEPEGSHHPLHFQADWLSKQRGGMIPGEVMDAVSQLQELAKKNGIVLEELCVYALGTEAEQKESSDSEGEDEEEEDDADEELEEDGDNDLTEDISDEELEEDQIDPEQNSGAKK